LPETPWLRWPGGGTIKTASPKEKPTKNRMPSIENRWPKHANKFSLPIPEQIVPIGFPSFCHLSVFQKLGND